MLWAVPEGRGGTEETWEALFTSPSHPPYSLHTSCFLKPSCPFVKLCHTVPQTQEPLVLFLVSLPHTEDSEWPDYRPVHVSYGITEEGDGRKLTPAQGQDSHPAPLYLPAHTQSHSTHVCLQDSVIPKLTGPYPKPPAKLFSL